MAEETIDHARNIGQLPDKKSITKKVRVHGCTEIKSDRFQIYGTDAERIKEFITEDAGLDKIIVKGHPYVMAEVVWSVRNEMARTVEDVLARRLRLLFLDARAAKEAAPQVAECISKELGLTEERKNQQLNDFYKIADQYILKF
jgi:glycerol-3-phosphate dehydrogenase